MSGQRLAALRPGRWLPTVAALAVLAGAWQLFALHNPTLLPTVPSVFEQLGRQPGLYARDLGTTLEEAAIGASCGFAVAFVLAVAMSEVPIVERAVMPLAVALNVTPVVAIAPMITLVAGVTSLVPRDIVAGLVVFFPFLVNSLVGLRAADPAVLEVAQSLDASRREVLWRIRLPSSLPFLFAAARIGLPLSVVGAVVAEFTTSGRSVGLGALIVAAEYTYDLPEIFAAIMLLALLGVGLTLLVVLTERRVLRWYVPAGRRPS